MLDSDVFVIIISKAVAEKNILECDQVWGSFWQQVHIEIPGCNKFVLHILLLHKESCKGGRCMKIPAKILNYCCISNLFEVNQITGNWEKYFLIWLGLNPLQGQFIFSLRNIFSLRILSGNKDSSSNAFQ